MEPDKNEFFRQATLRICSSLDVEKALFNFLQYMKDAAAIPFIEGPFAAQSLPVLWNC
ncbi:MAG: hypothetical protein ABSH41_23065 [Syntrophobacteraceae bacterium]